MNGKAWQEYFETQDTKKLKKLEEALAIVLSDPVIKKEFGEAVGLSWVKHFITMTLMEREHSAKKSQSKIIVGSFAKKKR